MIPAPRRAAVARRPARRRLATSRAASLPPPPGQYPGYGPPYDRPPPRGRTRTAATRPSYYQPIDSGGMSATAKVVLGVHDRRVGGFFLQIFAAIFVLRRASQRRGKRSCSLAPGAVAGRAGAAA